MFWSEIFDLSRSVGFFEHLCFVPRLSSAHIRPSSRLLVLSHIHSSILQPLIRKNTPLPKNIPPSKTNKQTNKQTKKPPKQNPQKLSTFQQLKTFQKEEVLLSYLLTGWQLITHKLYILSCGAPAPSLFLRYTSSKYRVYSSQALRNSQYIGARM